jgi:hypothetical protein
MTAATFEIRKYVGKDCTFGTPVSSIGIKRVDQVVPAVYGSPVVPGDDKSDANTYHSIKQEARRLKHEEYLRQQAIKATPYLDPQVPYHLT